MLRPLISVACLALVSSLLAQPAPGPGGALVGRVEGRTYVSPTGVFKVTIPVLAELGGSVTDTPNVVTFQDEFNTHVSIAAFPQDATQRWELSTRGLKDYLVYFFSNFVLPDFKQAFEGAQIESAKYSPSQLDGALITNILLPGGSMFADKVPQYADGRVAVAKRGNMLFVKNGHIFVVSTELAERAIEGRAYKKTTAEEDDILRQRLNDIVDKIQFARPPVPAPSAPPPMLAAPKK